MNGPPGSGKDTIANEIWINLSGSLVLRFKNSLYEATAALFNINLEQLIDLANDRLKKEEPFELFKITHMAYLKLLSVMGSRIPVETFYTGGEGFINISPRQALIYTSEVVYKPTFGKEVFGNQAVQSIIYWKNTAPDFDTFIFSDSGFPEEIRPIIKEFGKDNVYVAQLERPGCSFEGDSRNYVEAPKTKCFVTNRSVGEVTEEILNWVVSN